MNNLYANSFKGLSEDVMNGQRLIADALKDFKATMEDRYEKMGITKDLLDTAKAELRNRS